MCCRANWERGRFEIITPWPLLNGALSEKRKKDDLDDSWGALPRPWTQDVDKECFGH